MGTNPGRSMVGVDSGNLSCKDGKGGLSLEHGSVALHRHLSSKFCKKQSLLQFSSVMLLRILSFSVGVQLVHVHPQGMCCRVPAV